MLAFLGTVALWWLYFDTVAGNSRRDLVASEQAGRLARDAYTYLHLPIIAGVIVTAVGDELLIGHAGRSLDTAGILMVLGGPILFLLSDESRNVVGQTIVSDGGRGIWYQ